MAEFVGTKERMQEQEPQFHVFISYSRDDIKMAEWLQTHLKNAGITVFRDVYDILPSEEWWQRLKGLIALSEAVVFLLSSHSAVSPICKDEVEFAQSLNKRIFPVEIEIVDWSKVPKLGKYNAINLVDEKIRDLIVANLISALNTNIDWVRAHTRFLDRALQWQMKGNPKSELLRGEALEEAEQWLVDQPQLSEPPTKLHHDYIKASRDEELIEREQRRQETERQRTAMEEQRNQQVLSSISRTYQMLYINPLQALDIAQRGIEIKQTPEGEKALYMAIEVAKNRRKSKEEEAKLTGVGVGYLMERWRLGEVFTKLRDDGRYLLVASKRGEDGPNPPGTVFLISLDNLRTSELSAGDNAHGKRLEYMGFSSSGEEVFVARQFYLDIFDLQGSLRNSVQLEYHAKPTHLISGMFGSYVLVGDTVGHLMLADTVSDTRPQLRGGKYPDATLFIEANKEGTRAIVIFESGRTDLVDLQNINSLSQLRIAAESIIFATFSQLQGSNRFLTATNTGEVAVWNFYNGEISRVATFFHNNTPVGLAAFSMDEERVITIDDDSTIRLWNIDTSELISSFSEDSS